MAADTAVRGRGALDMLLSLSVPVAAAKVRKPVPAASVLLPLILTVQACLSVRLVWSASASTDEALYLWSGRLEWLHVAGRLPLPPFATYFSGAPVVYPPLGALAASIGGLAGARILSLCFMLGATVLLYLTGRRLFGETAGFFAAGMWAVLGPTQFLGAYATYDALSLFLMALAAWCVVHGCRDKVMLNWLLAAVAALVLANAAKYASMLFDPVVAVMAVLVVWPPQARLRTDRQRAAKHTALHLVAVLAFTANIDILLMFAAGPWYRTGIAQTTFSRVAGNSTAGIVLASSWTWIGAVTVAGLTGVVLCWAWDRVSPGRLLLLLALAGAAFLVPLEQARIDTLTSLDKHVDFGAWFAAIAAGYAISRAVRFLRSPRARALACAVGAGLLVLLAVTGVGQASQLSGQIRNAGALIAMLRPLVAADRGRVLMDYGSVAEYYLGVRDWHLWSSTSSLRLPNGRNASSPVGTTGNASLYVKFVKQGYFSLIILAYEPPGTINGSIITTLGSDPDYHLAGTAAYGSEQYGAWVKDVRRR